jgi:hypothetical protein
LWLLLVLWEYGGIVVSNGAVPNNLTPAMIKSHDDAVVILDIPNQQQAGNGGYSFSMDFMAVAPRHPLIFLMLQVAISNMVTMGSKNSTTLASCQSSMLQHQTIQATLQEGMQQFLNIHPDKILKLMVDYKGAPMLGQGGRSI